MIDGIVANIERCLALRRYRDEGFAKQLNQVQQWQHQRLSETYQELMASPSQAQLVHFFLDEVYRGVDLTHLARKLTKTAKLVDKLFTDLQLIHIAIEFNALNAELDESITRTLFEDLQVEAVNADNYAKAFARENPQLRQRQLELLYEFAREARDCVDDSFVYSAFKLAKYPAKLGGLGSLYRLIAQGFDAMRAVEAPCDLIEELLEHEQQIYAALFQQNTNPFTTYSPSTKSAATGA